MGKVNTPSNLLDRIRRLEQELAEVRKRVGLGNGSISAGSLTIQGGGGLKVVHPNGRVVAEFGKLSVTFQGEEIWGMRLARSNSGVTSWFSYSTEDGDPGEQYSGLADRAGTVVFSDDSVSGHGIATPYLPAPMHPAYNAEWVSVLPATASTSFVGQWQGRIPITHPKMRVRALVQSTLADTAGQGRLMMGAAQIGSTVTTPTGSGAFIDGTFDIPGWGDTVNYLDEADFSFEARRTAGTGKVVIIPYAMFGKQS